LGAPAASGPVRLVQEIDKNVQPGFLIYMPVYQGGEVPTTLEVGAAQARSTGHGSSAGAGETPSSSPLPEGASDTVEPAGTAPGCQLTVAEASAEATAPAAPG
jgi:hypothetical protein